MGTKFNSSICIQTILLILFSQPLKSSHTRVHETCRALNEVFKLAEDLKNPSLNKSQKSLMALLRLNAAAASMTLMESPKRPL